MQAQIDDTIHTERLTYFLRRFRDCTSSLVIVDESLLDHRPFLTLPQVTKDQNLLLRTEMIVQRRGCLASEYDGQLCVYV